MTRYLILCLSLLTSIISPGQVKVSGQITDENRTIGRGLNPEYIYSSVPANAQLTASWTHGNRRVDAWNRSLSRHTAKRYIYGMHEMS